MKKNMKQSALLSPEKFYDEISGFYEQMIDFEKNLTLRIDAYKRIFPLKGLAADIGCGIGLDSIALAATGHKVTAFDISPKMIESVKQNASRYGFDISTGLHSFESIPIRFNAKYNSVVSVGNTIAHLNPVQLQKAAGKIFGMLMPDGKVLLHILNYEMLRKQGRRINNIADRNGKTIIRFYDFIDKEIDFNILSFSSGKPKDFQLVTTRHYPHTKSAISNYLKKAGFKRIKFMKNFEGEKFSPVDSKDMFITVEK
jgi:ubiquinone/menaquinone biosynthesis C-methylase UbiE